MHASVTQTIVRSETFHSLQKILLCPPKITSSPAFQAIVSFSSEFSFTCTLISYKWNHRKFFIFGSMFLRFMNVVCELLIHSFYLWIILHCINTPQFICFYWYLGFFQFLTIIYKVAWMLLYKSFGDILTFLLSKYLKV